jgi:hypothetical protein
MDQNPYESPRETGFDAPKNPAGSAGQRILILTVPVAICAIAGAAISALTWPVSDDPRAYFFGSSAGGFVGLLIGLLRLLVATD